MADVLTLPVRAVVAATPRTRILRLDLKESPFVFRAGQAALIGLHGQPQRRPYSIASSPEDAARHKRLEFLVKVDDTGYAGPHLSATGAQLARHGRIDLEGPFGSFTLPEPEPETHAENDGAAGYLFIAGGTGLSPLRSMMRHLISRGDPRPISVIYSARTIDEFAYKAELQRLARQNRISLMLTVTGDVGDTWRGPRGRISASRLAQALPVPDPLCFVCGPPALVEDVPPLLLQLGVKSARIRTEEW